ncbi:hypothetical protein ACTMU2_34550 [Cupriavidus basilensis]
MLPSRCSLAQIAEFGTPTYVYSRAALTAALSRLRRCLQGPQGAGAVRHEADRESGRAAGVCPPGRRFRHRLGGELKRVLAAGGDPRKVVFSGVGKSAAEMEPALAHDVRCFNVESIPSWTASTPWPARRASARACRCGINPDVDAKTHPYISTGLKGNKFGIAFEDVLPTYRRRRAAPSSRSWASTATSVPRSPRSQRRTWKRSTRC